MERIRGIQQNLWQTKLFITHEKDTINRLQEELKNPINKINKLSWVINHKWRSLRTKKANSKELSDVDAYSQSLDKSRFFDAKDKIGSESHRYAAFLKYLRDKSNLVAVIFLTEGTKRRQPEELSELIHSMFSALYGFAILPDDEKRIIRVLGDIAKIQIAEFQGAVSSFFHQQSALSLSFRLYIEWSLNTRVYMGELMSDIVMNIIAEPEFLIVDEAKYQERYPHVKNHAKIRAKVDFYRKRIATHVISMVTQIRRHLNSFPPYLRWLGVSVVQYFQTYRGATQDDINIFLGELFYTRMLFYPFLQPQIYLGSKIEMVDLARHNLLQVTYTFREAFLSELGVPSSSSRIKYASVLPYLGNHTSEMVLLLEELVDVPYSSTVIPTIDIPIQRRSVLIPERDLHFIINLLMEVLASGKFQPEEKEMLAIALSLLPTEPCRALNKRRPGRRGTDPKHRDSKVLSLDDGVYDEEILVLPLPDVNTDKLKTESEVLGKNVDTRKDPVFDERKMSVLLTTDHPLITAQDDIKGRLLQDFDLLFHNPSLDLRGSLTPDCASLSSATSYDSLAEKHQPSESSASGDIQADEQTLRRETGEDTPTLQSGIQPLRIGEDTMDTVTEDRTNDDVSAHDGDVTPQVSDTPTSFSMEGSLAESWQGSAEARSASSLRVAMNQKSGVGFFDELSESNLETSMLRNNSAQSLLRHCSEGAAVSTNGEVPIDIITSEFVYQDQPIEPAFSEELTLQNTVNKLKIAFSLFPHFYKSYYPKIGAGPLTTIDLISLSPASGTAALVVDDDVTSEHKQLLEFLHSEYSDASVHNSKNAVQMEQAIIALKRLPPELLPRVLTKLEEYNGEQTDYIHYLMERKCELMRSKEYVARVQTALELKHDFFYQTLGSLVIQSFFKAHDEEFKQYRIRFKELLMTDEKSDLYEDFIDNVSEKMCNDLLIETIAINHAGCDERECPSNECTAMENHRKEVLRHAEIGFFTSIFSAAFLPNGEAQKQKDVVFRESLSELQATATLIHPDILIPEKYHNEAPWLPAQRHLRLMPSFKSPSGKLSCIMNCVFTIFKLLFVGAAGQSILDGKTDDSSVPGADDLLPVLIYVVIHANPPNLLSTLDYIDNFTPRGISGQDQYMLMQFRGAVEFIKTMLQNIPRT